MVGINSEGVQANQWVLLCEKHPPIHPSIHTIASWSHTVIWCIEFAQIKEFKKDLRTEWPQADHYAKCGKTSNHNVWVRCQLALHVCMYVHMSTNSAPNNVRTLDVFWSISGNSWTYFFCSGKLSAQRKRSSPIVLGDCFRRTFQWFPSEETFSSKENSRVVDYGE